MAQSSNIIPVTLAANEEKPVSRAGNYFYVVQSPVPVNIRADDAPFVSYRQGKGQIVGGGFTKVTLTNTTASAITVQLFVGFQPQLSDVKMVEFPPTLLSIDRVPITNAVDLPIAGTLSMTAGTSNASTKPQILYRRKSITVINNTSSQTVFVNSTTCLFTAVGNASGVALGAAGDALSFPIGGATSMAQITLDTDDPVLIHNSSGGTANLIIIQTWYQAQ